MTWVVVCRSDDVRVGAIKRQRLNREAIGLTRLKDNRVVAFSNTCPHMRGPLTAGKIDDGIIVCPWHFFRFDVASGEPVGISNSIMKLKIFPVREDQGEIAVDIQGRKGQ